jgi:hypothetical protein
MAGTSLTMEAIETLLASAKTRGDYEVELKNFINSDDIGIEVDLSSGSLAGKDPKNVATGFNNARKKMNADTGRPAVEGAPAVKVILKLVDTEEPETDENGNPVRDDKGNVVTKKEGHVFLINTAKLGDGATAPGEDVEVEGATPEVEAVTA